MGRDVSHTVISSIEDETHRWKITGSKGQLKNKIVDGKPLPGETIACMGLAIGLMANEPRIGKNPNCRYHSNHLITLRRIRRGEQLTVYYGPDYTNIRHAMGYRVDDAYLWDYCEDDIYPTCHSAMAGSA